MINISDKKNCCGCEACVQSCSVGCISMLPDEEGFLYPVVDAAKCIDCGLCERVCPILNRGNKPENIKVYAAKGHDEALRSTSSSGGVFGLLAEQVLSEGGAVFGAAFDEKFGVHHVMVERCEDLYRVKGSKYLQSSTEDTYKQAEKILKNGRPVLYSGTACQIAGLKSYLHKEYNNLNTVDVFCHGVPSPTVWKRYLEEQREKYKSEITNVNFRYKVPSWRGYSVRICFADGEEYCVGHGEELYIKLFLSEICLRPSCYDCKFRESRSGADLTIGDAWGVEQWMPHMDDNKGTSVVVVNTEKGQEMLERIMPHMACEETDGADALSCNSMYYKSVKPHPNRKKFFAAFENGATMDELAALAKKPLWSRGLSFGKRCIKKLLKLCGIRI